MREEITVKEIAIKGNIQDLLHQTKIAIQGGAEFYDVVSGSIHFYRLQDEMEWLTDAEKRYGYTLKGIKKRIKEIKEGTITTIPIS